MRKLQFRFNLFFCNNLQHQSVPYLPGISYLLKAFWMKMFLLHCCFTLSVAIFIYNKLNHILSADLESRYLDRQITTTTIQQAFTITQPKQIIFLVLIRTIQLQAEAFVPLSFLCVSFTINKALYLTEQ